MDFTIEKYNELLDALKKHKNHRIRHDVDARPFYSLRVAQEEARKGTKATYYFRSMHFTSHRETIQAIAALGHEIGYHYEDMAICSGNAEKAIDHFSAKLQYFRQFYPVKTICMHGAPRSKYDGKDLWKRYSYRDFGVVGEPYFDVDFNQVFYLTDTGRCWDGSRFSVRDKVQSTFTQSYHSTNQIIAAANNGSLPQQIMITTHPQRWTDSKPQWLKELLLQNAKNFVKRILIHIRKG